MIVICRIDVYKRQRQLSSVLIDLGDAEVADSKFKLEVTSDGTNWQAVDLLSLIHIYRDFGAHVPVGVFQCLRFGDGC